MNFQEHKTHQSHSIIHILVGGLVTMATDLSHVAAFLKGAEEAVNVRGAQHVIKYRPAYGIPETV